MLFNSLEFLLFFPAVTLTYFLIPVRFRHVWLLLASYYFYMSWSPRYALLMLFSTAVTWLGGCVIAGSGRDSTRRAALIAVLAANLGVLAVFKYLTFFLENLSRAAGIFGLGFTPPVVRLLLPVGISFYTFQALGYTIDVYRGDIDAEPDFLRYALFVSFFPQLVAGPIERSGFLLRQLRTEQPFDALRVRAGLVRMAWGLFLKVVLADRLAVFVDSVFNAPDGQPGSAVAVAAVLFTVQIYCDFGGYSEIAIGAAQVLGVTLMENFKRPLLSHTVQEFWRRWHISLSSWFRDYLYIPLGGSRKGKGRAVLNNMIVFLVSGLWHGASWHFVAWGALHGLYLTVGRLTLPARKCLRRVLHIREEGVPYRVFGTLLTFLLVVFAFLIFRANSLRDAAVLIRAMLFDFCPAALAGEGLFAFGLDRPDCIAAAAAMGVLLLRDLAAERGEPLAALERQALPLRWAAYLALVFAVLIFGIYGPEYDAAAFIYFEF